MLTKSFTIILTVCLASFTVLCAQRIGNDQSPWSPPRSYCDRCHHPLAWWQLIPLLGWIVQGGHCHFCRQRIAVYNPLCELASGFFAWQLSDPELFHSFLVVLVIQALLFIASCDYYHGYLYPLSLIALLPLPLIIPNWTWPSLTTLLSDLLFLGLLTIMVTRFHGLGGGDVLFIAVLLLTFEIESTVLIILLACLGTLLAFFHSHQERLPFLPALCLATLIVISY